MTPLPPNVAERFLSATAGPARRDVETYRYEVAWLGADQNVRVGTAFVRRESLDDAIAWAAAGVIAHPRAHGFHVERIGVVPAERSS